MLIFRMCLLSLFIILSFSGITVAKKAPEPVYSTQGYDNIDEHIFKNSQPSKVEKNEQNQKIHRSKEYIKLRKKINKYDSKRAKSQKEIEYLQGRLELSKKKLEAVNPTSMKGEKE